MWYKDINAERVVSKPAFQKWETGVLTVLAVLLAGVPCVPCPTIHLQKLKEWERV